MRVKIRSIHRAGVSPALSNALTQRVHQVLSVFEGSIREVMVVLEDVNGDKGGPDDKVCRLKVRHVQGGAPILADGHSDEFWDALNYALRRTRRQLASRSEAESVSTRPWAKRAVRQSTSPTEQEGYAYRI